jgi:hypothetical protein
MIPQEVGIKTPSQFFFSIIKQRDLLIAKGKSKLDAGTTAQFLKMKQWAFFWKNMLSDDNILNYMKRNASLIKEVIPHNQGEQKQIELFNQLINQ